MNLGGNCMLGRRYLLKMRELEQMIVRLALFSIAKNLVCTDDLSKLQRSIGIARSEVRVAPLTALRNADLRASASSCGRAPSNSYSVFMSHSLLTLRTHTR